MLNEELFLPRDYQCRADVAYYDDNDGLSAGIIYQPEIYPLAERLLKGSDRSRLVDIGCGIGRKLAGATSERKLGVDFGSNIAHCRASYPEGIDWQEVDLGQPAPEYLIRQIGKSDVVICSDVIEHIPDPRPLLSLLSKCFQLGALVITSTPDRLLVRGKDHPGPPPNAAHVREWSSAEYRSLLTAHGLPPLFLGLTHNNDRDRRLRTIVSIHEPLLQLRHEGATSRPLAILSCYNEEDVIGEVIEHWIAQGCDVHVLDNWSTDSSWEIIRALATRFGHHLIAERFPADRPEKGSWREILDRKAEIAFCHKSRWIIHTDADEIRRSPFPPFSLADAMHLVGRAGWNRIDFTVMNHRPVDDRVFLPGSLETAMPYFEFGAKPGHFVQKKAWLQGDQLIDLSSSGGHIAKFSAARDCPYNFPLHHFPLRSPSHGRRKITEERNARWSEQEKAIGWHRHYADTAEEAALCWNKTSLHETSRDFWATHGLQILSGTRQ